MKARLTGGVGLALIGLSVLGGAAVAQTKDEHEQHHPGGAAGGASPATPPAVSSPSAPALTPPSAAGTTPPASPSVAPAMPPMDMERMMREMQRMLGGPPKKPQLSRLLDAERFTEAERNALRGEAERRVQEGLRRLERGTEDLIKARRARDDAAIARAANTLKEGMAQWETGQAVLQALSSPAPRAAALQWFRAQMNLEAPSTPPSDLWGLSWRHAALMAILVLFGVGAVGLYSYKIGRSLRLLTRLSRNDDRS